MNPSEVLEQVAADVEARIAATGLRVGPQAAYPYVLVHVSSPVAAVGVDVGDSRSLLSTQVNTIVVGMDKGQCRKAQGRVVDALFRARPAVGSRSWKYAHVAGAPAAEDDSLPDRDVWSARDVWSLNTIR